MMLRALISTMFDMKFYFLKQETWPMAILKGVFGFGVRGDRVCAEAIPMKVEV